MVNPIILLESDGERSIFDPVALQDTLVRCFLSAGLRENCYLAEDIALAVEYAFEHSGRPGKVFSRSELEAAVVRVLGDTGLADVAALYQRGASSRLSVNCDTDSATVNTILHKFMAGSESRLKRLAGEVSAALHKLNISSAAPSLLVELARYYEQEEPSKVIAPAMPVNYNAVSPEEILPSLPPETRVLTGDGVIRIHGISRMFPSVRIFCFLTRFAQQKGIHSPVTELTLSPMFFNLGKNIEECRCAVQNLYRKISGNPAAELPVYLTFPDMTAFTGNYLGADSSKTGRLEKELAQMVSDVLTVAPEKITIA